MTKTVLITGAAKRLGRETAFKFAENNWHVIVHYNRSETAAVSLKDELEQTGNSCTLFPYDLSDTTRLSVTLQSLMADHPDLCVLVNNASIFDYDFADKVDLQTWHNAMHINALAPTILSQAFAENLKSSEGCIINILDQKLDNMNPDYFSYTISKSALAASTTMMSMAYQDRNIRVCNVAPGLSLPSGDQTSAEFEVSSKMNLLEQTTQTSDIANGIYFVATSNFASGQTLHIDSGQRFTPHARDVMFLVRES